VQHGQWQWLKYLQSFQFPRGKLNSIFKLYWNQLVYLQG
jgi:hypothetical protein